MSPNDAAKSGLEILSEARLRVVWKKDVRPKLRASALADVHFAQDPFHFLAVDINLAEFIRDITTTIDQGRYSSEVSVIVRSAKSKGLLGQLEEQSNDFSLRSASN